MASFETIVKSCVIGLEGLFRGRAQSGRPVVRELVFGFEQGFFLRWDDGTTPRMSATLVSALAPTAMRERLEVPDLAASWEPDLDDDVRRDGWSDLWRPLMAPVHLIAGGLALSSIVTADRERRWFSPACRFALSKDVENDFPVACAAVREELTAFDDAVSAHAGLAAWFAKPATLTWFLALIERSTPLTLEAVACTDDALTRMLEGVALEPPAAPSALEQLVRRHFSRS